MQNEHISIHRCIRADGAFAPATDPIDKRALGEDGR